MKPYYQTEDGMVTVYHARWEAVVDAGLVPMDEVRLIHADGPYGIDLDTRGRTKEGSAGARFGEGSSSRRTFAKGTAPIKGRSFSKIVGDDQPFDPAPLLALKRPIVIWGANHFSSRLPDSPSWILWDKRVGKGDDNGGDGEVAWSNLGGPLRIFRHLWKGTCRDSEHGTPHLGPTQKPIALSSYVFGRRCAKLKPSDLVFVPFMGSGPDIPAAQAMRLRIILVDLDEVRCRTAVSARLKAVPHPEAAVELGALFERLKSRSRALEGT